MLRKKHLRDNQKLLEALNAQQDLMVYKEHQSSECISVIYQ